MRNKAVYVALGVERSGRKDVLRLWIEQTKGAGFWLQLMTELKSRSVEEILIALIDGLTGFPFPHTQIHHCVVHVVRQSLGYVPHRERKVVALELKGIHQTPTEAAAETETEAEAALWGV